MEDSSLAVRVQGRTNRTEVRNKFDCGDDEKQEGGRGLVIGLLRKFLTSEVSSTLLLMHFILMVMVMRRWGLSGVRRVREGAEGRVG